MIKKQWKFLKFVNDKIVSDYDKSEWTIGKWRKVKPPTEECVGLNASNRINEARDYVQGDVLARVECDGKVIHSRDKSTWERMRIVRAWRVDDYEAKLKPLWDDYHAKLKPLTVDYHAKLKPVQDEYDAKCEPLEDAYCAKCKPLYNDYIAKRKPLDDDYDAKLKQLDDDYDAKFKLLDDDLNEKLETVLCIKENEII